MVTRTLFLQTHRLQMGVPAKSTAWCIGGAKPGSTRRVSRSCPLNGRVKLVLATSIMTAMQIWYSRIEHRWLAWIRSHLFIGAARMASTPRADRVCLHVEQLI